MKVAQQMKFATMDEVMKFIEQNQSAPLSELDTIDLGGVLDDDWSDDLNLDKVIDN